MAVIVVAAVILMLVAGAELAASASHPPVRAAIVIGCGRVTQFDALVAGEITRATAAGSTSYICRHVTCGHPRR